MAPLTAAPPKPRTKPYRRFLTSAFHRRFVHASVLALLLCYFESIWLGEKTSLFWSWFPFGPVGFRALALFISVLSIFSLRVAQMHIGEMKTDSSWNTFVRNIFQPLYAIQTLGWYLISAFVFMEVYIWSSSEKANLHWVVQGSASDRDKLNERPIYLRSVGMMLALTHACLHLAFDYDRVEIPMERRTPELADRRTHILDPPLAILQKESWKILYRSGLYSMVINMVGMPVYYFFIRQTAWNWHLYLAKLVWNIPRSSAHPVGLPPYYHVFVRAIVSSIFLVSLWQVSILLFSTFMAQEPLKNGKPLSAESRDPNGTLLKGLAAKKDVVQTFAFWELMLISQRFPEQRQTIFADIERDGGPACSQLMKPALSAIEGITTRIIYFRNPALAKSEAEQQNRPANVTVQVLPHLAAPVGDGNILARLPPPQSRAQEVGAVAGDVAKYFGQSPGWGPVAQTQAQNLIEWTASKPSVAAETVLAPVMQWWYTFLRSQGGIPWRKTFARRASAVVLGNPYGQVVVLTDAVEAVTRLLVASLAEDPYGKVQNQVPVVVRTFTDCLIAIDIFMRELPIDPTDVNFNEQTDRRVEDVELLVNSLKAGLAELLSAFQLYLNEVGLSGKDLREAREAARGKEN